LSYPTVCLFKIQNSVTRQRRSLWITLPGGVRWSPHRIPSSPGEGSKGSLSYVTYVIGPPPWEG